MPNIHAQEIIPIVLSNVELVTVNETSAAITWVTNLPTDTVVQWGTDDQLDSETVIDESVNFHMGRIYPLSQGIKYYYRVGSGGRWSDISSFTTLNAPNGDYLTKFAVVADTHFDVNGITTPNGMMYGESTHLLESLVQELNLDSSLDFVITAGDLTNGAEADFQGFVNVMDELNIVWYPLLGNHDKTFADWSEWYNTSMGRTDTYYSFNAGGYHIIILDSAVQGRVQGDLDEEQLAWLEAELEMHADQPTLIFMHHMADKTDINGITEEAKDSLDSILEDWSNVLSLNCGHKHQNIVTTGNNSHIYVSIAAVVSYPIGYSVFTLYGNGYTQAFHKIESELEVSEESRVMINAAAGDTDADEEYLGELDERSLVVTIPQTPPHYNNPPIISSVTVTPESISPDETATVTVSATDPEGDTLIYFYETTGGIVVGAGAEVTYHPPHIAGNYLINVKVSDGELYSSEKSAEISVRFPDLNNAPVLKTITPSAYTVNPGDIVSIEVTAADEDMDPLTYHYEPSAGKISGSGEEVEWIAPEYTGEFAITIWVSDLEESSEKKTITISVIGESKKDDAWQVPGFEGILIIWGLLALTIGFASKKRIRPRT